VSLISILGLVSMAFVAWFTWRAYASTDTAGGAQSRRESIIEAWVNIVIGFSFNFIFNLWLIPLATEGGHLTPINNFWLGWVFTTISIVRQYAIRRFFNSHIRRFSAWAARRVALASIRFRAQAQVYAARIKERLS
jgi:hypothetical protein